MGLAVKRTARLMIDAVGSLIDQKLTTSTTPTRAQVSDWLNEGVIGVFRFVPLSEMGDTIQSDSFASSSINDTDLSKKMFRISSVYRTNVLCAKLSPEEYSAIVNTSPELSSPFDPIYSITHGPSGSRIEIHPRSDIYNSINYVPFPFMYDSENQDDSPDNTSIPSSLEGLVVEYAAALARIQDEEPQQYQLYIAAWEKKLQYIDKFPIENIEGVL